MAVELQHFSNKIDSYPNLSENKMALNLHSLSTADHDAFLKSALILIYELVTLTNDVE